MAAETRKAAQCRHETTRPGCRVCREKFVSFLKETLIPDLREAGSEFTATDFKTCVAIIEAIDGVAAAPGLFNTCDAIPGVVARALNSIREGSVGDAIAELEALAVDARKALDRAKGR